MPSVLSPVVARASAHANRLAIVDPHGSHTYADLDRRSAQVAASLLDGRDDLDEARVAFQIAPGFEHVAVQWGIWRAGGIAVPLPMDCAAPEVEYLLSDADVSAAFPSHLVAPSRTQSHLVAPNQRAMILYTSGTTGKPKGVVITHANLTAQIESLVAAWEWTSSDRTLLVLPLHHVHGILNVVCCALWSGALLEMHPRFDVEAVWDRLASGELTVFTAVPTIYHRLIASWDAASSAVKAARSEGCRGLRLMMSGSSALPRVILERWKEITGHDLLERYGMTEVGMALSNPLHGERRPGYVGQPLPGVEARIAAGELQLRGPGVFSEYWRQPESTAESFDGDWFKTGDAAVLEDGAYRLLGRMSVDILKSAGHKISALEIEETLRAHPAILECVVVGVEDEEWGQRVCCAAELQKGATLTLDDLKSWARARLAPHKIPKDLACVERLPRNAMGKIVKSEVSAFFARPARPAHPAS